MSNTFNNLGKLITDSLVINDLNTGTSINNLGIDTNGNVVSATTYTDGSTIIGDGTLTNPLTVASTNNSGNLLLTGGASYSNSGLTFDVSILTYLIAGVPYTTTATTVTLNVGDPANPRFDAIVADDNEMVFVVEGAPAVTPLTPAIGENQVLVQYVLVGAGATTPNITTEYVYREGSSPDWTPSVNGDNTTADFSYTGITPYQGTECVLANIGRYGYTYGVRFSTGTPVSRADYVQLSFWVYLTVDLIAAGRTRGYVFAYADNTPVSADYLGFVRFDQYCDFSLVGQWQLVSIPTGLFTANLGTNTTIGFLNFTLWPNLSGYAPTEIAFDDIRLSTGYGPSLNVATIDVLENGTTIGDTARLNFVDGSNTSVTLTDDNVNNKLDVQVNLTDSVQSTTSSATGTTSFAFGFDTKAYGEYSHAEGNQTTASGYGSHAEGELTMALGQGCHAEGLETIANGFYTHTEGRDTITNGYYSHAEGYGTQATGDTSHSEGRLTKAYGQYSHAEGQLTTASGVASHAEGYQTTASGAYSHAEGFGGKGVNVAYGQASHVEGIQTTASGTSSHAEGQLTIAIGQSSHAEGEFTIASGFTSHAEGYNTSASGDHSHSEGFQTMASGEGSHAEGFQTIASGDYSHVEGYGNLASGIGSHAEGGVSFAGKGLILQPTSATTYSSHAEGIQTLASGQGSHAEGTVTVASGRDSHAEGYQTIASGDQSHAEGTQTLASGQFSHAEGLQTTASGDTSHAGGNNSIANGTASFIHSTNSLVTGDRSVVLGGQNITGSTSDMVYIPNLNIVNIISANDDSDAGLSGLTTGDVYQTSGLGASPLNVAGILMIKQ